ncbi:PH domain-containing protein [Bacillus massiliglaciei]|uniref:PH domain-containing protein n=1 Tax=Bacillus massiliglaciei TaxID=1816693 RepID=UPI000A848370|nr:PH domain-containing protein [Bacillus massiliglaciei]
MEPRMRISEKGLSVWRIQGLIECVVTWVITAAVLVLTLIFDWPFWIVGILLGLSVIQPYFSIFFFPSLRWKRWRYEVRETEIDIQRGIFIVTRTLIPMIRVQHVETAQGPLLRKHDLATIQISTAADVHEIPSLNLSEADELRQYISRMASVEEEDV